MNGPAFRMPAWSSAETGVGVSMTSTSQPWVGNCADFRIAAMTMLTAAISTAPSPQPLWTAAGASSKMRWRLPVPKRTYSRIEPPTRKASPTRATMNFFLAARTAPGLSG